jgi:serine/threonine protein kinase
MKRIDKYEVVEELGTGGMSRVYKCYDKELERNVAIKELRSELKENQDVSQRFLREAKIIAKLDHPNIVRVYEFLDLKRPPGRFFVMEYVDGVPLSHLMEKVKILPISVACYITLKVSEGLAYAHNEGIIHRDIKPSNVMISKKGDVKIMDFGISRSLDDSLTSPGIFIGTPAYASPEQLEGSVVDNRTDIFSFGAMFFEMLTGRVPFKSDETKNVKKRWKYVNSRRFNKDIPRFINRLLKKCLQRDPSKRYSNIEEPMGILFDYVSKKIKGDPRNILINLLEEYGFGEKDKTVSLPALSSGRKVSVAEEKVANQVIWRVLKFLFVVSAFAIIFIQYHYVKESQLFSGPKGSLRISVVPWGDVIIKNYFEGRISDVYQEIFLPVGEYSVRVENPFCEPYVWNVKIKKDITFEKKIDLKNCK